MTLYMSAGYCYGMPADNITPSDGESDGARKKASSKKPPAAALPARLPFTFINQHSDEKSLADKKIVSSRERHAIRSHVMKSVRHSESLAGKKRPTGRERAKKSTDAAGNAPIATTQDSSSASPSDNSPASQSALGIATENMKQSLLQTQPSSSPPSTIPSTATSDLPRPVAVRSDFDKVLEGVEEFCFSTFIPLTFPVERNSEEEYMLRRRKILVSKSDNPAVFYGMMATVAAFRAIFMGRHDDLKPSNQDHNDLLYDTDYKIMKGQAFAATIARIHSRSQIDESCVEAIFSLIGAASIIGNFEEARLHLRGIKQVLYHNDDLVDLTSPQSHWIPLTDVKAAVGMLRRPYFRLPWDPESIPEPLLRKITPPRNTGLAMLGTGFGLVGGLSIPIRQLLHNATYLCWFSQFNREAGQSLNASDHEIFRRKTLELEYDLLSYVYQGSPTDTDQMPNDMMHTPLEKMIRLSVLGMISHTLTKVLPSAGVGRALTQHQLKAKRQYFDLHPTLTRAEAPAIMWIMLQYVQGAEDQIEEEEFTDVIGRCRDVLQIGGWTQVEQCLMTHLYIPCEHAEKWKKIWDGISSPGTVKSDTSQRSGKSPASAW